MFINMELIGNAIRTYKIDWRQYNVGVFGELSSNKLLKLLQDIEKLCLYYTRTKAKWTRPLGILLNIIFNLQLDNNSLSDIR